MVTNLQIIFTSEQDRIIMLYWTRVWIWGNKFT